jgi:hypothetical protein
MRILKNVGFALLAAQCSFNIVTVVVFLFAPTILRHGDGNFTTVALILVWGGGLLSIPAVGIFSYATQKEQTYQKASAEAPEGGKLAQRDLSLAIVGFVSEMITLYWVLR